MTAGPDVLISGGAGFIGSALARKLAARGRRVTVIDCLSPQIHGAEGVDEIRARLGAGIGFVRADIRDVEAYRRELKDGAVFLHLAAETGTGQSMYQIGRYVDVNVRGTAVLLDLISNRQWRPSRFIVASSRAIYGEGLARCTEHGLVNAPPRKEDDLAAGQFEPCCPACGRPLEPAPTHEASTPNPLSVYAQTKLAQEQLSLLTCAAAGVPAIALRFQNVYGPGQSLQNPYTGILSIFSTAILRGETIRIFEDGHESRDFVFIDDVVAATLAAIEADSKIVGAFNVGTGRAVSVATVVARLAAALALDARTEITGEFRKGDIRHNFADLTLAKAQLGFAPRVAFEAGIAAWADWVRASPRAAIAYEGSLDELRARGLMGVSRR